MSIPRLSIRKYVEACEDLLKIDDLTDEEIEAVQKMVDRISEKLPTSRNDGNP
jgi:uncharacterized protein YpuA (DUF1002 family)